MTSPTPQKKLRNLLPFRVKRQLNRWHKPAIRQSVKLSQMRLKGNGSPDIIWIIGDGRSGSTWLQNLFMHANNYLGLFEPFHTYNPTVKGFQYNHYQRPATQNPELERLAIDIFNLKILDDRVVRFNSVNRYQGIVIKDVFASLLAKWAVERLPHRIRPVTLIRNPIDVALSKRKLNDWVWGPTPSDFLNMPELLTDHVQPFSDEIRRTSDINDPFLNHLLVWCILNRVLLNQFNSPADLIVRYEDLQTKPVESVRKIMGTLNIDFDEDNPRFRDAIYKVSHVSDAAGVTNSRLPSTERWMKSLSSSEIDNAIRIVDAFGLSEWCSV